MAKIHNPQDQDGILLINQTTFDGEVAARTSADADLQGNIDKEIEDRKAAIESEKTRAEGAEATLQTAINTEKDRAMTAELNLTVALSDEITRAQEAENRISAVIDGEVQNFSTDKLTAGIYSSSLNKPSAINIHNSIFPAGIIKSIEIPDANITSARYLSVKVVDGLSDTIVDYTSSNTSTTKWNFDKFIKKHNISDNVYYKLVLSDAAGNSSNIYFGNISYNNGNFANCGFGGNWPNPDGDLTVENGATGLTRINIEFEPNLNDTIQNTKENIISIIDTLETKVDEHVEALNAVDASLLAKIDEEKNARISADENINTLVTDEVSRATAAENELSIAVDSINDQLLDIEGKVEFTTLEQQPTSTSQWIAIEFKGNNNLLNQINNKPLRSISFKVANTVTTPHYLAVYDTRVSGTKNLIAISKKTTWVANESVTFAFDEPIVIPGEFELFLLSEPISGNHTQDLPAPSVFVESYTTTGTQNYRLPTGSWAGSSSSARRGFYATFNFVADRLGTLENEVSSHTVDTVKHITAEERSNWNAKASAESVSNLEAVIGSLATKEEIANFVTEETVDQKIANVEHHKPIFDLSRNVDKVIFDLSASSEPQIVTLTLSEGKVFAGQAVSSSQIISTSLGAINPGVDSTLSVNIGLQETPAESTTIFVIVDTICDSVDYDNAQHVAEVIPVEINVPAVSE